MLDIKVRKKLVFAMYCYDNMLNDLIQKIHIECLKEYMPIFDEVVFWLNIDDRNNTQLIEEVERTLISCSSKKQDIRFHIDDNTPYRECICFNEEVVKNKKNNDLIFFGHNKGTTNISNSTKRDKYNFAIDDIEIYKWVIGLYFFSLSNMDFVNEALTINNDFNDNNGIFFGSFLNKYTQEELDKATSIKNTLINKYNWVYTGTFYWVNTKNLHNYIEGKSIEEPILTDRFFAENYPGNIVELDTKNMNRVASYGLFYNVNVFNFYKNTGYYIEKTFTPEVKNKYEEFYNKIIEKANKK